MIKLQIEIEEHDKLTLGSFLAIMNSQGDGDISWLHRGIPLCISNNDPYNTQMRFSCDKAVISRTTCQEFSIGWNRGLAEQKEVQAPGTILSSTEEVYKLTNIK
jgi:hypothetical protein